MQKYLIILFFVALISSCARNSDPISSSYSNKELMEFREIAWNDLSDDEIETVIISKEELKIQNATVSREDGNWYYKISNTEQSTFVLTNPSIDFRNDQKFVIVTVNTSDDALMAPIIVIIEPNTKLVFGRGTRG